MFEWHVYNQVKWLENAGAVWRVGDPADPLGNLCLGDEQYTGPQKVKPLYLGNSIWYLMPLNSQLRWLVSLIFFCWLYVLWAAFWGF